MTFEFRPAIREQVGLLIGLIGPSGGGKTFSAMRLASGICGGEKFAVIDTEARRSLHYADMFKFDMGELHPPFRPEAYAEAIIAADKAGYKAIVVDSMSHEHAGEGGICDWQEEELQRMAGENWQKREACKMAAWIKPKMAHKKMVQRLLQIRAPLILCFRAEEKVKMEKDEKGKTIIVPAGWQPICEKNLPYEMTVSFLLTPDRPGYPNPIKLQKQHQALFPLDKPVDEVNGSLIAAWGSGKALSPPKAAPENLPATTTGSKEVDQEAAHSDAIKQLGKVLEKVSPAAKENLLKRAFKTTDRQAIAACSADVLGEAISGIKDVLRGYTEGEIEKGSYLLPGEGE